MNALEWGALAGAAPRWAALARSLETPEGGLEAVFDDAGRAGLGVSLDGDGRRWRLWARALAAGGLALPAARAPRRAWAFFDGERAVEAWSAGVDAVERHAGGGEGARGELARHAGPRSGVAPLDALLADLDALHPVADVALGLERLEVRLARPAPWPFFAVLDLAKPFAARSAAWARRLGARGVAAFALGTGRMEVFLS